MKINVLSTTDAIFTLRYSEGIDHYLEYCQSSQSNYIARKDNVYAHYTINSADFNAYHNLFNTYIKHLPKRLLNDIHEIDIVILMPSADNGFPHTRPTKAVCFPKSGLLPSLKTFNHELWHIHQRLYKPLWEKIYTDTWKFTPYDKNKIPDDLRKQIRLNPDTMYYDLYSWRDEWVPLPIFVSPTQPKMNECEIWFWNTRTHRVKHSIPDAWESYFGGKLLPSSAHEHPNELSAYMLSELKADGIIPQAFKDLLKSVGITSIS